MVIQGAWDLIQLAHSTAVRQQKLWAESSPSQRPGRCAGTMLVIKEPPWLALSKYLNLDLPLKVEIVDHEILCGASLSGCFQAGRRGS